MRVIAVDWSGDRIQARKRLWLAEVHHGGDVLRLEAGRSRSEVSEHLADLVRDTDGPLAIGLDFGFSYPAWFLSQLGLKDAPALWDHISAEGEAWLRACDVPFWGHPGRTRSPSDARRAAYRRCERGVPRVSGFGPKSMFQIGGAGAVGTGSIRGMPLLAQLHRVGARIWPFTPAPAECTVVEIYPRLLTGPVFKSQPAARIASMRQRFPAVGPDIMALIEASEDAFDAAFSALVMAEHTSDLCTLPPESDPELRVEGRIWHPAWRADAP
ncbi:MAG: hypothetical protein NVSMB2_14580 [Chloroflexota bacterium]